MSIHNIIYMHTNLLTGQSYIGYTTKGLEDRFKQHITSSIKKKNMNKFHKALTQYTLECWESKILFVCLDQKYLKEMEVYFIQEYKTFENGYNSNKGGSGTPEHSIKTKKLLSTKRQGKTPNLGNFHSEETKNKFSEQRSGEGNSMYGKLHSITTKQKMSEIAKKRCEAWISPTAKKWKAISPSLEIYVFTSGIENFCIEHNLNYGVLRKYLNKGPVPNPTPNVAKNESRVNSTGWQLFDVF